MTARRQSRQDVREDLSRVPEVEKTFAGVSVGMHPAGIYEEE